MLELFVLCTVSYNAATFPSFRMQTDYLRARSHAHCADLRKDYPNGTAASASTYELPRETIRMIGICGDGFKDCKDKR